jgi:hypothetical protein
VVPITNDSTSVNTTTHSNMTIMCPDCDHVYNISDDNSPLVPPPTSPMPSSPEIAPIIPDITPMPTPVVVAPVQTTNCPPNSFSRNNVCYCFAGYEGPNGGPCIPCYACTSVVSFTVTLSMSLSEFDEVTRAIYVEGVAETLSLAESMVRIGTVSENSAARRLLASTIAVETIATVPSDRAESSAAAATFEKLNNVFTSSGISVGSVSDKIIVAAETSSNDPAPRQPYDATSTVTILVVCTAASSSLLFALCIFKTGKYMRISRRNNSTDNETHETSYTRGTSMMLRGQPPIQASLQVGIFFENMQNTATVRNFPSRHDGNV